MTAANGSRWRQVLLGQNWFTVAVSIGAIIGGVALLTSNELAGSFPVFLGVLLAAFAIVTALAARGGGLLLGGLVFFSIIAAYYHHHCSTAIGGSRGIAPFPQLVTRCPIQDGNPPETGAIIAMGLLAAALLAPPAFVLGRVLAKR